MTDSGGPALREAIRARVPAAPTGIENHADEIARIAAAIVERFQPTCIVLFGSRVYGTPTEESDIDLMVVMETSIGLIDQALLIRQAIAAPAHLPLDIKVRPPARIAIGLAERDFFIRDVMTKGVTLFEVPCAIPNLEQAARETDVPSGPVGLKQASREWLEKGQRRLDSATQIAELPAARETVCYFAQEAATASLKAFLQEREIEFNRTHDVSELAELASTLIPALRDRQRDLRWLSMFTQDVCYPNTTVTDFNVERAVWIATDARSLVRHALKMTGDAE